MRNVFDPSFGNRPDCIVGRDEVLAGVDRGLAARPGSRDRAMLITGQRGMGKTALLLEIETRAQSAGFVTARAAANERMLDNLIERLQVNGRAVVDNGKKRVRGVSAGAFGFSLGLTFSEEVRDNYGFQTKLSLLCDRLAEYGRGVLILLDEVRSTFPEMRVLADAYQQLVGDGKDIAICMAGLPSSISSVLNDKVLTFLNRAKKIHLEKLPLPPVRAYYARTFDEAGLMLQPRALERAVTATDGFPYLLQLIGYYIIEEANDGALADDELLDRALADARNDMEDNVFRPLLSELSATDKEFLKALAHVADKDGTGRVGNVTARLGKSNGYVQVYRKRLLDAGAIVSPRDGELEFAVPLLREYLAGDALSYIGVG